MAHQNDWEADVSISELLKEETLQHATTVEVFHGPMHHADTAAIKSTTKSTDEVVEQMKKWLRTGVAPDGTRMMTDESWQWHQDFYQGSLSSDQEHESLPSNSLVDYSYWAAPYFAHIGEMSLIMMHAQVNFEDGTHMPADRLRAQTKHMENLEEKAKKRVEVESRKHEAFVSAAMDPGAHRGHPLRKEGIYTKYFWRPFLKQETFQRGPTKVVLGRGMTKGV